MFLNVEGDKLINLDLIDEVELKHSKMQASLWSGGTVRIADSAIAYTYLMQHAGEFAKHESPNCADCGQQCNTLLDLKQHKPKCQPKLNA